MAGARELSGPGPMLSRHARRRLQQRGLGEHVVGLLCRFGRRLYNHDGTVTIHFDRTARQQAQSAPGMHESWRRAYLVQHVASGLVLTVGHRTRRLNR